MEEVGEDYKVEVGKGYEVYPRDQLRQLRRTAKERQSLSADGSNLTGNPLQTSKHCFENTVLKRCHNFSHVVDTV